MNLKRHRDGKTVLPPTMLRIDRYLTEAGRTRYTFEELRPSPIRPVTFNKTIEDVDAKHLLDVRGKIDKLFHSPEDWTDQENRIDFFEQLRQWSGIIYDELVSKNEEVNRFFATLRSPLLINTNDPDLPWELLHDGNEFLGLKTIVGRQLVLEKKVTYAGIGSSISPSFLFVANPTNDPLLPESIPETDALINEVKKSLPGAHTEYLFGDCADCAEVKLQIRSGKYDFIHYSGHIDFHTKKEVGSLRLADGPLYTDAVSLHLEAHINPKRHPIVFLNGCTSATSQSVARGFLEGGAMAVLGTLHRVPDGEAKDFALCFYNWLLRGGSIGEATRKARRETKWAGMSYIMFGNPCLRSFTQLNHQEAELLEEAGLTKFYNSKRDWYTQICDSHYKAAANTLNLLREPEPSTVVNLLGKFLLHCPVLAAHKDAAENQGEDFNDGLVLPFAKMIVDEYLRESYAEVD